MLCSGVCVHLQPHYRVLLATCSCTMCRRLAWQSDDLTALGPCLTAFTAFTTLRHVGLSCSGATLDHACAGGDGRAVLQAICPYATLDLNQRD